MITFQDALRHEFLWVFETALKHIVWFAVFHTFIMNLVLSIFVTVLVISGEIIPTIPRRSYNINGIKDHSMLCAADAIVFLASVLILQTEDSPKPEGPLTFWPNMTHCYFSWSIVRWIYITVKLIYTAISEFDEKKCKSMKPQSQETSEQENLFSEPHEHEPLPETSIVKF